ncbi:theronine dehydrogenase [Acetobacter conturbans]|uniref:Theronine dehydrogenase n=1 Tax=Acetobacter conturbans TaxID=1737472 RepID=A0ABX0K3Y8_9PROT|nr:theronine dehydrogenase [Acetobacter conturbans]NHN89839.1 theronine dehydrogenase [Acetobacter conturbans]
MPDMVRWSLAWRNPNTAPSGPRVMAAVIVPVGTECPAEVMDKWVAGAGYAITWELVTQRPVKRWSREAKARVRKGRLKRRLERQYPLLAELLIEQELAKRPAYYEAEVNK